MARARLKLPIIRRHERSYIMIDEDRFVRLRIDRAEGLLDRDELGLAELELLGLETLGVHHDLGEAFDEAGLEVFWGGCEQSSR